MVGSRTQKSGIKQVAHAAERPHQEEPGKSGYDYRVKVRMTLRLGPLAIGARYDADDRPARSTTNIRRTMDCAPLCQQPPIGFRQYAAFDCELQELQREFGKISEEGPTNVGAPGDHAAGRQLVSPYPRQGLGAHDPRAVDCRRGEQGDQEQLYRVKPQLSPMLAKIRPTTSRHNDD